MSKNAIVFGLIAGILASQFVGIRGANASTALAYEPLTCSPVTVWVANGEFVSFKANPDYSANALPQPQLTWTAIGGNPTYGYGSTFGTRFYIDSVNVNETRAVSVTNGYETSTCMVYVYNSTPSPVPANWFSLDHTVKNLSRNSSGTSVTARNGDRLQFIADITTGPRYAEDVHIRDWLPEYMNYVYGSTTVDGVSYPDGIATGRSSDSLALGTLRPNRTYNVRFEAIVSGAPNVTLRNTVNVHVRGLTDQSRTSTIRITGSSSTPTPTPTITPTPTVYPNPNARVELRALGRNVTLGQTGEYTSIRARGGDTLDLIIRVRSTNGSYLSNTIVTNVLPTGLSYIPRSTSVNGNLVSDGITGSGINVGTLAPNSEIVVKFAVTVNSASVPVWGAVVINTTMQVRADGLASMSVLMPITLSQNFNLATASAVPTGPIDSLWLSLLISMLVTGAYAAYTRTDMFGRRTALSEVNRLSRTSGLDFSK